MQPTYETADGRVRLFHGDCVEIMGNMPKKSVDLVFGSPPYEAARTYGIGFGLRGQAWVDWMVDVFKAALGVSRGLVAMVLEGQTRDYRWSATPALLMADLHRAGIHLRKPPAFHRVGVPGSGGPDWLRNDYEFIVCATSGGKLPWSENTAMGHTPKWGPGGEMSNRLSDGTRRNQWGGGLKSGAERLRNGEKSQRKGRKSHVITTKKEFKASHRDHTKRRANGEVEVQHYSVPAIANPGNIVTCLVGGNQMGDALVHENEAGFPERLAEFFVRSFCPPGGTVLDPFSGSGTTAKVAIACNRMAIGIDIRESQIKLTKRRTSGVQRELESA